MSRKGCQLYQNDSPWSRTSAIRRDVAAWRIVFFGTPEFAVPSLQTLLNGADAVVGVVCQPDKPAGRGQHLAVSRVKEVAVQAGVALLQPEKVRTPEFLAALRQWAPDLIVVAAYGRILPTTILDLPPQGCINVHASLLPKYRGAAPIQWAILQGESETGVTIMRMNEQMDAGDMLLQRATPIGSDETYGELQTRLAEIGADALQEAIAQLHQGSVAAQVQDASQVTLAPMIQKAEGRIDWQLPASVLARRVRAFNPWPSAFTRLGDKLLKLHRVHAISDLATAAAGAVMRVDTGIHVATGDGVLVVDELQLEGRKRLGALELARGGALHPGLVLG
jgi:methionyl-tRNA formyltransferase